ncbi:MAG: Calcineurin-like phosphoeSPTERase [Firmicutes bacterium]|nr:Calcineurin-like phosphoeSPTERase [Bacillota bacterium]
MGYIYPALVILTLIAFISWLNYRLLSRLFRSYRIQVVRFAYLILSVITIVVIGYGWSTRPLFAVPDQEVYLFLVYGILAWLLGQIILLVFQPFIYVAHRLITENKQTYMQETGSMALTMTRRDFLHNTLALTPLVAFGLSSSGIYEAQTEMIVERHSIIIPTLPSNLKGFKIGQISDTHLGPYFDLTKLDTVLKLMIKEKPDMVVITGDFVDDLKLLKPAIDRLNEFHSLIPHGIYFCYGNHEYFRNIELVRAELHKSRLMVLDNKSTLIIPGQQPFYLMGVDYPWANVSHGGINISDSKRQQCFAAASQGIPPDAFKVLIAHHPDFLIDGFTAKIPLTLAGHTHGGQVVIMGKSLQSSYTYMRGLYQQNGVYGYVSSGAGQWFPFRFGCPPEISIFTLLE